MSYLNTATYQEREKQWREQAAGLPPGPDRDACLALAGGYGNLIALLDKLIAPSD
ncbi:hypothetical protein [Rhodopila sp.]|uniref:hypothetical protein n=1 Tax=Rhodopila sp. TaxID=2480087 RepID=UPI003D12EC9B